MRDALLSLLIAGLSVSGLIAADGASASAAKPIRAKYSCNKGQSLKVVFTGNKAVVTPKGGKGITLRQRMAADGFLYSSGKYSLRGRGDNASWTTGRGKPLHCIARS